MPPPKRKAVSRSVSPEDPVETTSKEGLQWVYNGCIVVLYRDSMDLWFYMVLSWMVVEYVASFSRDGIWRSQN